MRSKRWSGAIYLDSDLETARRFILEQAATDLAQLVEEPVDINPEGTAAGIAPGDFAAQPGLRSDFADRTRAREDVCRARGLGRRRARARDGKSKKQAETAAAIEAMRRSVGKRNLRWQGKPL